MIKYLGIEKNSKRREKGSSEFQLGKHFYSKFNRQKVKIQ